MAIHLTDKGKEWVLASMLDPTPKEVQREPLYMGRPLYALNNGITKPRETRYTLKIDNLQEYLTLCLETNTKLMLPREVHIYSMNNELLAIATTEGGIHDPINR